MGLQLFLLGDDCQTEVDRQHDAAQGPVVLGCEVVESSHYAVSLAALGDRVVHRRVEAAPSEQLPAIGTHAPLVVRLAKLCRDAVGRVVQIAPAVGPANVVHDEDRKWLARLSCGAAQHLQLVIDGVPVVIAVDQGHIRGRQVW